MGVSLFERFAAALNGELAALDCCLRIDAVAPVDERTMWLLDEEGRRLGRLPDHTDALTIASLPAILSHAGLVVDRPT